MRATASAPRLDAVGGAVVDEDQSHPQAVGGSIQGREQRADQVSLVRVDHAHVQVEFVMRAVGRHGRLTSGRRGPPKNDKNAN